MSDYLDRIERQLVQRADELYGTRSGSSSAGRFGVVSRFMTRLDPLGVVGQVRWTPRRGGSWSLPGIVLGVLGGLVVAMVMSLGASSAPADFTLVRGKGGMLVVKANPSANLADINTRLAQLGIPIRLARSLATCTSSGSGPLRTGGSALAGSGDQALPVVVRRLKGYPRALLAVRVRPPTRPGQTLVLAAGRPGGQVVGRLISGRGLVCTAGVGRGLGLLGVPS